MIYREQYVPGMDCERFSANSCKLEYARQRYDILGDRIIVLVE